MEQERVGDREHGSCESDAECERQHDAAGPSRAAPKCAHGELKVLSRVQYAFSNSYATRASAVVRTQPVGDAGFVTKAFVRRTLGVRSREPSSLEVGDAFVEVESKLVADVAADV